MAEEVAQLDDGIYSRLPQNEYHAQNRLSASGCANLLVSPGTFWADSWLNPNRETDTDPTDAQIVGTAYHVARLEPERFHDTYARQPDPADYPEALMTATAIGEALAELGLPKKKAGEGVLEQARRLHAAGYDGEIWHLVMDDWSEQAGDRIALKAKTFDEIDRDMNALRGNEELLPFITGGQSEVSVFWTDELGVRWKARFDYLKPRHVIDLKTFENSARKELDRCIHDAIAYNRYYIQARVYWTAAELIRTGGLPIKKIQNQAQKDLIEAIRASADPFEYWWIFQEKRGVPNVLARQMRMTREVHPHYLAQAPDDESRKLLERKLARPSRIWEKATIEVEHCRRLYLQCMEIWGTEKPWGPMVPVSDISDDAFSPYFLEN